MPTREQLHKEVDAVPDGQLNNAQVVVLEPNGAGEPLDLATINQQGDEALAEIRAAFADVPEEEIEREAVKATREARHEMAAERNAPEQAA